MVMVSEVERMWSRGDTSNSGSELEFRIHHPAGTSHNWVGSQLHKPVSRHVQDRDSVPARNSQNIDGCNVQCVFARLTRWTRLCCATFAARSATFSKHCSRRYKLRLCDLPDLLSCLSAANVAAHCRARASGVDIR